MAVRPRTEVGHLVPVDPVPTGAPWGSHFEADIEAHMTAEVGDRITILGHRVGEHDRTGEIQEVRGTADAPAYVVVWLDDGHVSTLYPGTDAVIRHVIRPAG